MRAELYALFPNLSQVAEAEDLEPAAVGQNRAVPRNEFAQPAQLEDGFVAGPEKKVIGVSENDSRVEVFEHLLRDGLDRAGGPDRHEDGRLDLAVGGPDPSGARLRDRVFIFDFEKLIIHEDYSSGLNNRPSAPLADESKIIIALPTIKSRGTVPQYLLSMQLSRLSPSMK